MKKTQLLKVEFKINPADIMVCYPVHRNIGQVVCFNPIKVAWIERGTRILLLHKNFNIQDKLTLEMLVINKNALMYLTKLLKLDNRSKIVTFVFLWSSIKVIAQHGKFMSVIVNRRHTN